MYPIYKSILKKLWITTAALVIVAASISSLFRALTPFAIQYKSAIEQHLSTLIGQPVSIQNMDTGWYWFQPVLKLEQVTVNKGSADALHLDKLLVGINIFKSLWDRQIQPGVLVVDDIHLVLRQHGDNWAIDGISTSTLDTQDMTPAKTQEILVWLAGQERLIIRRVSARMYFKDGTLIPISALNIAIHNKNGHYKIKGSATLNQTNTTNFQLMADLQFDPYHVEKTKGQIYFAAANVSIAQLYSVVKVDPADKPRDVGVSVPRDVSAASGTADLALWVDLNEGLIHSAQGQVKLKSFSWNLPNNKHSQLVQTMNANISWKQDDGGWRLQADDLHLRVGGLLWPENKISLTYDKTQQSYQLFLKSLVVESLLATPITWPQSLQQLVQMQPKGVLSDTHITFKENQLLTILTRFDQLSWNAQNTIPKVENLSGVLSWQPDEGHLELDSEHAAIQVKGYPKEKLKMLNAAIEWKQLNDGLRVSIDRLILTQPDKTVSVEGAIDQVTRDSLGHIRINASYSGLNTHKLMRFLPQAHMKPKLYAWLLKDIKRINKGTANIVINGYAKDFPFDNTPGEFTINGHVSGADLLPTLQWPLISDIEAYIKFSKRDLEVDIAHGDAGGVPIDKMNLRIDAIGKNKETLLIHGLVDGNGQKVLDFVMKSPLAHKLGTLKSLALKGMVNTDLRIEVPLYPENDDVIVRGDLHFKDNTILFHHQVGAIEVKDVSGSLSFTEKGIKDSALQGALFGNPLQFKVQSIADKQGGGYTSIGITGACTVDSLKNHFNLPAFAYLKGMFYVNASLKLSDDSNGSDILTVNSNLQGLAIDLPEPFGKTSAAQVPLQVNIAMSAAKGAHINVNYNNIILGVIAQMLPDHDWAFKLTQKNIAGSLLYHPLTNTLSGTLSKLHIQDLKFNNQNQTTNIRPQSVPNLNLRIDNLSVGNKNIGAMTLKTQSTEGHLNIDYCRIEAPEYQFQVQGAWIQNKEINQTKLDVQAHFNDIAKSLARWDITPALNSGKGDMEFKGYWNNTIFDFSLASLNGAMYIKLKKGIITHLSPETEEKLGLGKLLSILSLQTIPRRLQLDFSDLSHEGYSFDIFKGKFEIKKGIMSTQDSYLDGPVAYAGMKGELDLVRHLYDLHLSISPHITASLPVVATIAGGPVVGLAAYVANKLINQGMQRISAYSYKVTGPWSQPVVQQVSMVKQIIAKDNGSEQYVNEQEYEN